jgi:hypothetical protein
MNQMFDTKEIEKKLQDFSKQVKQVNDFWIDTIITTLKQLQK